MSGHPHTKGDRHGEPCQQLDDETVIKVVRQHYIYYYNARHEHPSSYCLRGPGARLSGSHDSRRRENTLGPGHQCCQTVFALTNSPWLCPVSTRGQLQVPFWARHAWLCPLLKMVRFTFDYKTKMCNLRRRVGLCPLRFSL